MSAGGYRVVYNGMDATHRRVGNRYRLQETIGHGGMGSVWAARDEVLGRDVAVKQIVFPAALTPERRDDLRERSLREARAAARISCPHAVKVFDVVDEDGQPWIVMERMLGRPLSQVISQQGRLPAAQVIQIALQVLEALTAAHASGVLHRDVKPSNVLLRLDGTAVLTDFGIAAMDGDSEITATGQVVGSPDYLAPERVAGPGATPATDLWSLGCLIFTAVEGRSPFARSNTVSTLDAVVNEDPALPSGPLAPVLRGLLAKRTALRLSAETTRLMLCAAAAAPELMRAPAGPRAPARPAAQAVTRPPPPAASWPAKPRPDRRHRRRWRPLALAAFVAVATLTAGAVAVAGSNDQGHSDVSAVNVGDADEPLSSGFGGALEHRAEPATPRTDPAADDPAGPSDQLPAGFRLHVDETGFAVAVPADWSVSKDGSITDFVEPGGDRFLRIDQTQTPKPDPVADWENQEVGVSQRLGGYSRIMIEPVVYRDYDAADWEFTWQADSGSLHVLNRNTITGPDRAYALYWSTPEQQWEGSLQLFETFAETFSPAP